MGAGCGAGRFWEAFTPLASCPAQVGGRRNIRLNGEQGSRILANAAVLELIGLRGKEANAQLLPKRIVAALNSVQIGPPKWLVVPFGPNDRSCHVRHGTATVEFWSSFRRGQSARRETRPQLVTASSN
jgi:hypothetical protein